MIHEKVSGVQNSSQSEVGGEDWDAPHVHDFGDMVLLGVCRWTASAGNGFGVFYRRGKILNNATNSGGTITIHYDTTVPIPAGATLIPIAQLTVVQTAGDTYDFSQSVSYPSPGTITITYPNGNPAALCELTLALYAEVG